MLIGVVQPREFISSTIHADNIIEATIYTQAVLRATLDSFDLPEYTGEYDITPSDVDQALLTSGMAMVENVVVHKIPYVEVTNIAGGKTATIG